MTKTSRRDLKTRGGNRQELEKTVRDTIQRSRELIQATDKLLKQSMDLMGRSQEGPMPAGHKSST